MRKSPNLEKTVPNPDGTFRRRDFVLAILPAALLGALLPFCYVVGENPEFYRRYMTFIVASGAVVAFYALTMVAVLVRAARRNRALAENVDVLKRRNRALATQLRGLQSQIELLTAMRQVSRLASDDVRFERIATDILQIVGDLVGASQLTLFLREEPDGRLVAQAQRIDGKTVFGSRIGPPRVDADQLQDTLRHQAVLRTLEHDLLDVLVPLVADQEPLGVLHLTVPLEGDPEERTERAELIEQVLTDVATHVSLAVKTTALHTRAVQDGATGLYNKTFFLETLAKEMENARRQNAPLSLVMLDIDHFKMVNDTFGHPTGDHVLAELAGLLKRNLRRDDSAYRYGGEEMAVLLPGTARDAAEGLAERLRRRIETRKFRTAGRESIDVTVSLGVGELTDEMPDPLQFIHAVDQALYAAKNAGRNCVRVAGK